MEYIDKIKKMLCKELDEYAMKGKLTMSDVDAVHKLSDTVKNLDKIAKLESGYSEHYPYNIGSSYARRGTHYVRGHYSRDDGERDYSERYDRRYSRDDAKDRMMDKLGEMMEDADPKEREALKECMRALEKA